MVMMDVVNNLQKIKLKVFFGFSSGTVSCIMIFKINKKNPQNRGFFYLGQSQNDIITILLDRDYIASVKENIYTINGFAK